MALSIRTNIASLNAQRNLSWTQGALDTSLSRLSSGYRITKAGDDAAGLAISTKLESQIKSFAQAARNANDGISVVQSTEAALNETANMLTRLRELAMQSASDGISNNERAFVDKEAQALLTEIARIAAVTKYNGVSLLDGTGGTLSFQVGIEAGGALNDNKIDFDTTTIKADLATLGIDPPADVDDPQSGEFSLAKKDFAQAALGIVDTALSTISTARADLGAIGNRLQSAINNISAFSEALSAANSRIKDVDIAEETAALSRAQILAQAGISVLAQANQMPQMALKLLS